MIWRCFCWSNWWELLEIYSFKGKSEILLNCHLSSLSREYYNEGIYKKYHPNCVLATFSRKWKTSPAMEKLSNTFSSTAALVVVKLQGQARLVLSSQRKEKGAGALKRPAIIRWSKSTRRAFGSCHFYFGGCDEHNSLLWLCRQTDTEKNEGQGSAHLRYNWNYSLCTSLGGGGHGRIYNTSAQLLSQCYYY
jgi:hypothetical protein